MNKLNSAVVFEKLKQGLPVEDIEFNTIYPGRIQELDKKHWTPVAVAQMAAQFLVNRQGIKVLDIGSGVGKFCMIGAAITGGHFTGVEYRKDLYEVSNELKQQHNLKNVEFVCANITTINFKEFNAFYFFNSFIENMSQSEVIDDSVPIGTHLYARYNQYLREQFAAMPMGTRLVTYWGNGEEVPRGYMNVGSAFQGELKMWEKLF